MEKYEIAVETFKKGFNCAQAVFSAYSAELGIDDKTAKVSSAAFGGGIARQQLTCGAVTGALMLIGSKFYDANNHAETKNLVYDKSNLFLEEFKRKHKTISCMELLGFDMKDEAAMKKAKEEDTFQKVCSEYIADAGKIVEKIIA